MAMIEGTDTVELMRVVLEGRDPSGLFLRSFDPDAYRGRGSIVTTRLIEEAQRFDSFLAVMEEWKRQSTRRPLRPDGEPNRPLTAWSIEPRKIRP
jgi:hypothetical protein